MYHRVAELHWEMQRHSSTRGATPLTQFSLAGDPFEAAQVSIHEQDNGTDTE